MELEAATIFFRRIKHTRLQRVPFQEKFRTLHFVQVLKFHMMIRYKEVAMSVLIQSVAGGGCSVPCTVPLQLLLLGAPPSLKTLILEASPHAFNPPHALQRSCQLMKTSAEDRKHHSDSSHTVSHLPAMPRWPSLGTLSPWHPLALEGSQPPFKIVFVCSGEGLTGIPHTLFPRQSCLRGRRQLGTGLNP